MDSWTPLMENEWGKQVEVWGVPSPVESRDKGLRTKTPNAEAATTFLSQLKPFPKQIIQNSDVKVHEVLVITVTTLFI